MSQANCFTVSPGYRILFRDLGINAVNVLRLAELPGDLFAREQATLKTAEYFRLWRAIEKELDDPTIPIRIGSAISVEAFDPPIFAALHSPNLNTALARIARYKKLVAPMALHVEVNQHFTSLDIEWLDKTLDPPEALVAAELVFFVQLARLATRTDMRPLKAFVEGYRPVRTFIVCNERAPRVHEGIHILPWRDFLQMLWSGAVIS